MKCPNHSLKQRSQEQGTEHYHSPTHQVSSYRILVFWLLLRYVGQDSDNPDIERHSLEEHQKKQVFERVISLF